MMRVVITKAALKQVDKLETFAKNQIIAVVAELASWPKTTAQVKALQGNLRGKYRARTGSYRVFFTVDSKVAVLTVYAVEDRKNAY